MIDKLKNSAIKLAKRNLDETKMVAGINSESNITIAKKMVFELAGFANLTDNFTANLTVDFGSWAESNAVCFSNSYTSLITNRESGLSALATALTGFAPEWGLHLVENRVPNIVVDVDCELLTLSDWSILGDWIGKQVRPDWKITYGPMPFIQGLPSYISFASKKALTAAAANYGCPMLWAEGHTSTPSLTGEEESLKFTAEDLAIRYEELAPKGQVDLIVIGCPQALSLIHI